MTATELAYAGSELALFADARNWKSYWARALAPYVGGRVLDVGAGIGSNVAPLMSARVSQWTCLEPDAGLVSLMRGRQERGELPAHCTIRQGVLADLPEMEQFNSVIYIDVLEHIADDGAEVALAARHLAPGGQLVVLCPAHQFLFSPFDAAIGHHRRYSRAAMMRLAPPNCQLKMCRMLDSVGFFASLANKLLLRSARPTAGQIGLWDRGLVPLSRLLDPLLLHRFGKTVIAVWTRV